VRGRRHASAADSLCAPDETVFFNCRIKDSPKLLSVCGRTGEDARHGATPVLDEPRPVTVRQFFQPRIDDDGHLALRPIARENSRRPRPRGVRRSARARRGETSGKPGIGSTPILDDIALICIVERIIAGRALQLYSQHACDYCIVYCRIFEA
jgi:hypothetical protein